jgi:hypothetical protein
MILDVDLTSGDTAFGGNNSVEDGVPDQFLGVGNKYLDEPRSRWGMIDYVVVSMCVYVVC